MERILAVCLVVRFGAVGRLKESRREIQEEYGDQEDLPDALAWVSSESVFVINVFLKGPAVMGKKPAFAAAQDALVVYRAFGGD